MTLTRNHSTSDQSMSIVSILGVPVHDLTGDEALQLLAGWLEGADSSLRQVVTVNPEFIMAARRDPDFMEILQRADLATADGIGIILAARLLGGRIRERLTGVDLTEALAAMSPPVTRIFLLGAAPGIAEQAASHLENRYPGVSIAGTFSGSPSDEEADRILERLRDSGANVLLVAFGAPAQDNWIAAHRQKLAACGIVLAIGVGGTFDYLAGTVPRAPRLIRRIGLEWLYRLIRQPWRWRRQLALPHFVLLVLRERISRKRVNSKEDDVDLEY
jgi:N-acetylglucosaminyldiphosphoundecaprenol N-acetyl-beta-D-mannosaminyltransferase